MQIHRFIAIPLLVLAGSIFAQDNPANTPSGFLSNYQRLTPALTEDAGFHQYLAPDAATYQVGKVYVKPIGIYPEDIELDYVDRATLAAFFSKLDAAVARQLGTHVKLVESPEQADTIIQFAVTAVSAVEPNRRVVDFIPLRLLTKPLKDAAMGKQQAIAVQMEMSVKNAHSGEIVAEALGDLKGKTMGRTGDIQLNADIDALNPVIDEWSKKIVDTMSKMSADAIRK